MVTFAADDKNEYMKTFYSAIEVIKNRAAIYISDRYALCGAKAVKCVK